MDRVTVALGWAEQYASNGRTMQSSALVALADARHCAARGDGEGAIRRALDSLCYSLGWYDERVKIVASWVRQ